MTHAATRRPRMLALSVLALGLLALATGCGGNPAPSAPTGAPPSAATPSASPSTGTSPASAALQATIDQFRQQQAIPGMAVAVVTPPSGQTGATGGGTPQIQLIVSGSTTRAGTTPVTAQTQFEMGSESKTFTAALLATMVAQGKVGLDDPVQKYAPAGVTVPSWTEGGQSTAITLRNLATHTAALPDVPTNINAGCPDQKPCATAKESYTRTMLWSGLQSTTLLWRPGTNYLYSNFAFGLLGTILADVLTPGANPPAYGPAVQSSFLGSLPMSSTALETVTPRLATPYAGNAQAPYWNNTNAFAGGGGLISDVSDMSTWVSVMLGYAVPGASSSTAATIRTALQPEATITNFCSEPSSCKPVAFHMGLAWQLYDANAEVPVAWVFKNGGTAGMTSVTYFAPSRGVGVTILSNDNVSLDQFGKNLLVSVLSARQ